MDASFEKEVIGLFALEAHQWLAQIQMAVKQLAEGPTERCVRSSTGFSCTALLILPSLRRRCSSGLSSRWPQICFRFSTMWGTKNHVR